jgi:26S proteasome regulatory subunit N12
MEATLHPPVPFYTFFLTSIMETVRTNIGECVLSSYKTLTCESAKNILMFQNIDETIDFIMNKFPEWKIENNIIDLRTQQHSKSEVISSKKLIEQTLSYASELERIV